MEIKPLREKPVGDLEKLLREAGSALAKLSFEKTLGKLKDKSQIGKKRKEIARISTVLGEKKILQQLENTRMEANEDRMGSNRGKRSDKNIRTDSV